MHMYLWSKKNPKKNKKQKSRLIFTVKISVEVWWCGFAHVMFWNRSEFHTDCLRAPSGSIRHQHLMNTTSKHSSSSLYLWGHAALQKHRCRGQCCQMHTEWLPNKATGRGLLWRRMWWKWDYKITPTGPIGTAQDLQTDASEETFITKKALKGQRMSKFKQIISAAMKCETLDIYQYAHTISTKRTALNFWQAL